MKGLVLHINNTQIRLDETFFINVIVKPLFVLLIYFGLYSRTFGFFGMTGGMLSVYISFALFLTSIFHLFFYKSRYTISQFTWLIFIFFVLSGVIPLIASFVFEAPPGLVLRFSIEVAVTFFMFFSVYYFIREKVITPKFFIYTTAILGFLVSIQLIVNLVGMIRVRRIRTLSGLNYMGNSFAMAIFCWIVIMYQARNLQVTRTRRWINYFCFLVTFLALLLTGTRAGLLALIIGIAFFQFFGLKSKKFKKYFFVTIAAITAAMIVLAFQVDLSLLLNRYSYEHISRMAGIRMDIYIRSINDLSIAEFILGRPDLYLFSDTTSAERIINPHNIFLGLIRFNGLIPFMLFMGIFFLIFYQYFRLYNFHKKFEYNRVIESTTLVLFVIVLIYTLFSGGRITRSFAFYIVMGYVLGYFELFKNLENYEDYKKLIL